MACRRPHRQGCQPLNPSTPLDGEDDEDITSFTSQQTTARQFSNLRPLLASPSWSSLLPDVPARPLVLECVVYGQRALIHTTTYSLTVG